MIKRLKAVDYLTLVLCGSLLVASIYRFKHGNIRWVFQVQFETACLVVLSAVIWSRYNKWFGLFLLLVAASPFLTNYDKYTFLGLRAVLFGSVWYLAVFLVLEKTGKITMILNALCLLIFVNVFWQVLQECGVFWVLHPRDGKFGAPTGLMGNEGEVAAFYAMTFPALLRGKWHWGLIPVAVGLALARTSGGVLGVVVAVLLYSAVQRNLWIPAILAGLCLTYYFLVDKPSVDRWEVWVRGWAYYKKDWLTGLGIGHWRAIFDQFKINGEKFWQAHNEFVQMTFELGIGFAVVVAGYFLTIGRAVSKKTLIPAMAIAGLAGNCLVNFPFHVADTAMIAVTWIGIADWWRTHDA